MSAVEIFGIAPSTYTRAVRMACEEKGVAYELIRTMPQSPEALALHPFGKIPILRHDGMVIPESKAIAAYLDKAFDGPALLPTETRAAAQAEQWVSLVNTVIDKTLVRTYIFAYFFPKTADKSPDRAAIDATAPDLRAQIGLLDKAVAPTGYLAGNQFSFADMNLMPILAYVRMFPEGAAAIGASPALAAYYERHSQRPSFKNTIPPPPAR
jgi:glutathione S-transferase